MTFFALLFLFSKIATSGFCALYSYLNSRHITAPKLVWYMFLGSFSIWFVQTCLNGYFDYHHLHQDAALDALNSIVLQLIKLALLMGACVIMNQNYRNRETSICRTKH